MAKTLFTLRPRLEAAALLASGAKRLADIGSDHALLPIWLLLHDRVEWACAADISPHSVEKARRAAARYGLCGRLCARESDGLSAVGKDEADTIVLSGLGGETIAGILAAAPWTAEGGHTVIVQCMSSLRKLDAFLAEAGFTAEDERIVRDAGRLYSVAKLRGGRKEKASSVLPSRHILGSPLKDAYLNRLIYLARKKLNGITKAGNPPAALVRGLYGELALYQTLKEEQTP